MPFRYTPTRAARPAQLPGRRPPAWTCRRFFHPSPRALSLDGGAGSGPTNHYETLGLHPTATAAEIKRSFYLLSKRHHPDHNPTDPHAPARFMRISEAYAVLGHAEKRARYDREHVRLLSNHHPHHHHQSPARRGSYHSTATGPAGGRPASGLSRRRGAFQGPPPSFYRSGGWGAYGAKRRAAHEESTGAGFGTDSRGAQSPPPPPPNAPPGGGGGGGFGTGGMGPGQDPFGHGGDVPHFDRAAHERAQRRVDDRRAHRIARERGVDIDHLEKTTTTSFFGVAAILAVVVMAPFLISGIFNRGNGPSRQSEKRERGTAAGGVDKEGKKK
ncbi:hypothetical protein VTH06DRAFT_5169 [Thermothelomyces fergusii]